MATKKKTPPRDKKTGRFLTKRQQAARKRVRKAKRNPAPKAKPKTRAKAKPRTRAKATRAKPRARTTAAKLPTSYRKNPRDVPANLRDRLEMDYVDAYSLASTLEALGRICHEKGIHLRETWGDAPAGRVWEAAGNRIDTQSVKAEKAGL